MMKQLIKPIDIRNIAGELENSHNLEIYWDYRDCLSDEQIIKIIKDEEGLSEAEIELFDYNRSHIDEIINTAIESYLESHNLVLDDEQLQELRQECDNRFNYNIEGLIKNSSINIRIELLSNEDMIYYNDWKHSDTIKEFKRVFKGKYKRDDLIREFNNLTSDYGLITFYFKVKGLDILKLREQVLNGFIELRKGLQFGLFNSWVGGGSVLEMQLLKNIQLNIKDWRVKDIKEELIKSLNKDKSYYEVNIKADKQKYGIQEVYGLSGWQEW